MLLCILEGCNEQTNAKYQFILDMNCQYSIKEQARIIAVYENVLRLYEADFSQLDKRGIFDKAELQVKVLPDELGQQYNARLSLSLNPNRQFRKAVMDSIPQKKRIMESLLKEVVNRNDQPSFRNIDQFLSTATRGFFKSRTEKSSNVLIIYSNARPQGRCVMDTSLLDMEMLVVLGIHFDSFQVHHQAWEKYFEAFPVTPELWQSTDDPNMTFGAIMSELNIIPFEEPQFSVGNNTQGFESFACAPKYSFEKAEQYRLDHRDRVECSDELSNLFFVVCGVYGAKDRADLVRQTVENRGFAKLPLIYCNDQYYVIATVCGSQSQADTLAAQISRKVMPNSWVWSIP